ncbi:MAG TPA: SRPBCC domain-containing protein [Rhodanobacter sp.]
MRRVPRYFFAAAMLACTHAFAASTAAAQAGPNGFFVKHEVVINAPPAAVYEALVGHVGQWWNPQHTFSGDAENLSLDARPGGCFCEKLPNGGGLEHLRVVYVAPPEMLRMTGALGPLQGSGAAGSLTWKLASAPRGTTVVLSYGVGGFMEGGLDRIAPAVGGVLGEQLRRLKSFVETGKPIQQSGQ